LFSKTDLVAAYKQVPCQIEDLRIQGFVWLKKFFVETRQIFGAKASVSNFDVVGDTLEKIAVAKSGIDPNQIHRQLDDLIVIGPEGSGTCEHFSLVYQEVCDKVGVELAKICPRSEKAFQNKVRGRVLGIDFDSTDMTWSLPDKKRAKCLELIIEGISHEKMYLVDLQKLHGRTSNICQMCPFMKLFMQSLNKCLAGGEVDPRAIVFLPAEVIADLHIWAGFLNSGLKWLPICPKLEAPPIRSVVFCSDAAGCAVDGCSDTGPGCGSVGLDEEGMIIFARRLAWPDKFISSEKNDAGVRYGDNSAVLEVIGVILPFLSDPSVLRGKRVLVKVDNLSVVFGIWNKGSKSDTIVSIFVRALYLIGAYLECVILVDHLPRKSDWESNLVDRLSRKSTISRWDRNLLDSFQYKDLPEALLKWLNKPTSNWKLANELLDYVIKIARG